MRAQIVRGADVSAQACDDGDEAARAADPLYAAAVERSEADRKTWMSRVPIIAGYKAGRS